MLRQLLLSEFDTEALRGEGSWALLAARFPAVAVQPLALGEGAQVLRLDVEEWRTPGFDPFTWDPRVFSAADAERLALHLVGARGAELATTALEILTRYQGLIGQRNAASSGPLFDHLLERHRGLHELSRPRTRARYQHALDAWQWVLRLEPEASLPLQLAAVFHEHALDEDPSAGLLPSPGVERTCALLEEVGVDEGTRERVRALLTRCGSPHESAALAVLDDADALSFLSLNSSGFLRHFSTEPPRRLARPGLMARAQPPLHVGS